MRTWLPASATAAVERRLALEREAFRQGPSEVPQGIGRVVRVIPVGLTGEQPMKRVMEIVVPLRLVAGFSGPVCQQLGGIVVVLQKQVHVTLCARPCAYLSAFSEDVSERSVARRMFFRKRETGCSASFI